jgi:probable phosphoglycerate mutase
MTTITLVRHGTTEWMEQGLLHGSLDSNLSKQGKREATLTASILSRDHFDNIYISPSGRAKETADPISQVIGISPIIVENLKEMDFGFLEGRSHSSDSKSNPPSKFLLYLLLSLFIGEPWRKFNRRISSTLDWIISENPTGSILIVSHNAVISTMLHNIANGKKWGNFSQYRVDPCSISKIDSSPNGLITIIEHNNTKHLEEGNMENE